MSIIVDRVCRLLQLLENIRSARLNAPELAAEIEVSVRTIYRDIRTLQAAGVPILFDYEKNCYVFESGMMLPPTNFTPEEALALLVLCADLGQSSQLPFFEPARSAALKLAATLPQNLSDDLKATNAALRIHLPATNRLQGRKSIFDELVRACQRRYAVRIGYKSPAEEEAIVTLLRPYKLLFSVRSWYVIGRSSIHREPRTFHIGRISKLERTDTHYRIPTGFTVQRYLRNAWRLIPESGGDSEVVVRFSPLVAQNVAEVAWHSTQQVTWNEDGSIDFQVTVSGLHEISWWILGYGSHAEVLKPTALRRILTGHIERMAEIYRDEDPKE